MVCPYHKFHRLLLIAVRLGIWDCLSSQQVIDLVRYQVSQGKELTAICEMILEHCLAPSTESGNKGCDNMTLLIVGITHGRTKKAWYKWIKERVKNRHGHKTRETPPRLYPQHKLDSFRAQQEARRKMAATASKKTPPKGVVAVEQRSLVGWVVAYFSRLVGILTGIVTKWKR